MVFEVQQEKLFHFFFQTVNIYFSDILPCRSLDVFLPDFGTPEFFI